MKFRIKEICKEKGMLMEDIATMLSIHPNTLTRNINGNPTIETLEKIASALNVSVFELFEVPASGSITCPACGMGIKLTVEAVSKKDL